MIEEIMKIKTESETTIIEVGKISSRKKMLIDKIGARVFKDGKIYSASNVGEISPGNIIKMATKSAIGIDYNYKLPGNVKYNKSFVDNEKNPPIKKDEIVKFLEFLKQEAPDFMFNGKITNTRLLKEINRSNDVDCRVEYIEKYLGIIYKHKDSSNIMDGYFEFTTANDLKPIDLVKPHIPFLKQYNNNDDIKSKKTAVAFFNSESILFDKLAESLVVDNYFRDSAIYSGRLGEKIFGDKFTLYDVNLNPASATLRPFDDEGVVRENSNLLLIENGVFKNLICDLKNSSKYKITKSGNGKREFDSSVRIDFNSLVLNRGINSYESLLNGLDECIFVVASSGGDCNDNGDISLPVNLSYLYKNGSIVGRLPQLTLTSSLNKMFGQDLIDISSNSFVDTAPNPVIFINMDVMVH